jgi:hypothetical protein
LREPPLLRDPVNLNAAPKAQPTKAPRLHWPLVWTLVVAAVLYWGSHAHLERYITAQRGLGYWLGIIGGCCMLLLLIYSARKRYAWLRWMGGIPAWFEFHMVMGVLGPVLILFHSNFKLGATNSNVALFSMLLVASSGVVGRYIYTRLHAHLDNHEDTLEALKKVGERLRNQPDSTVMLPGVLEVIEQVEERLIVLPNRSHGRFLLLFTGAFRMARARYVVRAEVRRSVHLAQRGDSRALAQHAPRIGELARRYAYRRLDAARRTSEFQTYARLFSFWHVLHIPLFFMLLFAGIAHVVAINVY